MTKEEVLNSISNDPSTIEDIKISAKALVEKYDIEICSGSALIIDLNENRIDYVYTAGGLFFDETRKVMDFLRNSYINIYIASGDNKQSLKKIASILKIRENNVFDTVNMEGKLEVVKMLQNKKKIMFIWLVII